MYMKLKKLLYRICPQCVAKQQFTLRSKKPAFERGARRPKVKPYSSAQWSCFD